MKPDDDLQRDIRNELVLLLSSKAEKLDVRVLDGVVTLTGSMDSDPEQWNVEDAVRRMPGVRQLVNETMVVTPDAPSRGADADTARPWFPSS
ncbi:MAG: BON domain-containing protein [Burkholderiaceae bacterium]